jgi:hypothetical protein
MSKVLILLVGAIGSGKSTVANYITKYELDGVNFIEDMFAKPLKEFAISLGFKDHQIYGTQEQKLEINDFWKISGRTFMQQFGSDVCRTLLPIAIPNMEFNNRNLWARIMESKINSNQLLVISDGRFLDEAKLVKDYGGKIIKIIRGDFNALTPTSIDINNDNSIHSHTYHVSETEMDSITADYIIYNNGTLENLENQVYLKLLDIITKIPSCNINTLRKINGDNKEKENREKENKEKENKEEENKEKENKKITMYTIIKPYHEYIVDQIDETIDDIQNSGNYKTYNVKQFINEVDNYLELDIARDFDYECKAFLKKYNAISELIRQIIKVDCYEGDRFNKIQIAVSSMIEIVENMNKEQNDKSSDEQNSDEQSDEQSDEDEDDEQNSDEDEDDIDRAEIDRAEIERDKDKIETNDYLNQYNTLEESPHMDEEHYMDEEHHTDESQHVYEESQHIALVSIIVLGLYLICYLIIF